MDTATSCDRPPLAEASSCEQMIAGTDGMKQEMPDIPADQPDLPLQPPVKRRVHTNFDDAEEAKLLGLIQNCPIMWDSKLRNYKNVEMKSAKWAEWAQMLNTEEIKIRTWYTSMRTKFGRLTAQAQNPDQKREITERETWVLENFAFLSSHIKRARPANKMPKQKLGFRRKLRYPAETMPEDEPFADLEDQIEEDLGEDDVELFRPPATIQSLRYEPYVKLVPLSSSQIRASQLPRSVLSTQASTNQPAQSCSEVNRALSSQSANGPHNDASNLPIDRIPASQVVGGGGDPTHTVHSMSTSDAGSNQQGVFPDSLHLPPGTPQTYETSGTPHTDVISGAHDPHVTFTNLLGSMHGCIHQDLWAEYMGKSFNLLMAYVNQSARLKEVENQRKDNRS